MTPSLPSAESVPAMLQAAMGQIQFARDYTIELLDNTPEELWYTRPDGLPTHVAWQVGHMAVSQYGLLMFRIRGREPDDLDLIPSPFRKRFGRGGKPPESADGQPTASELKQRLQTVHQKALAEIENVSADVLLEPVDMPYAAYPCKLGAVLFCPIHEQLHSGQIGLLRRSLGLDSIR